MKRTSFEAMNCSIARALEVVGEWWTLLVLREAFLGVRRFEDFQERLGIARNVLTARLKALAGHGVLERRRYQERPARFEYVLTEKGRALYPVIVTLMSWGDRWCSEGKPPVVLADRETREPLDPVLVCKRTGRPVDPRATLPLPGPGARPPLRKKLERLVERLTAKGKP